MTIDAASVISGEQSGVFGEAGATGIVIENAGLIEGTSGNGIFLRDGGTVDNLESGIIQGRNLSVLIQGGPGAVTNAGTITITDNPAVFSQGGVSLDGGTLDNLIDAVIDVEGTGVFGNAFGDPLEITNAGLISSSQGNAIQLGAGGTVATGSDDFAHLVTNDGLMIGVIGLGGGADRVVNNGTIRGDILLGAGDDEIVHNGTIESEINLGAGDDRAVVNAAFDGRVEGDRTIGIVAGNNGTFINDGIADVDAETDAMGVSGRVNNTVINNGVIEVHNRMTFSATGIGMDGGNLIQNNGTIRVSSDAEGDSDATGIFLSQFNNRVVDHGPLEIDSSGRAYAIDMRDTEVVNTGTIRVTAAENAVALRSQFGVRNIENHGVIEVTGDEASALLVLSDTPAGQSSITNTGDITAAATGVLQRSTGIFVTNSGSDGHRIDNNGTIVADVAISGSAGSFPVVAIGPVVIVNSGTLAGDIVLDDSIDTIDNVGTITGNLFLNDGNDVLRNLGQIAGFVNLGAGNDTYEGSAVGDGQNFPDFVFGGDGNDMLTGIGDFIRFSGGDGNDVSRGDTGVDFLFGNAGDDQLFGGPGTDVLSGGPGADLLNGDDVLDDDNNDGGTTPSGNDVLIGGAGNDELVARGGADGLIGGSGDDVLTVFGPSGPQETPAGDNDILIDAPARTFCPPVSETTW